MQGDSEYVERQCAAHGPAEGQAAVGGAVAQEAPPLQQAQPPSQSLLH